MIESKIEFLTLQSISGYISRNPTAKLSKADFSFIMGNPNHQSTYLLVQELENPHLFLVLLRQAFLLFLSPILGNEIDSFLTSYYRTAFGKNVSEDRDV